MKEEYLEEMGLGKNEVRVYLALLNLGESKVDQIAKQSGIYRRTVYDALNGLIDKGLVSYIIKDGKKYFTASEPKNLLKILKQREEKIKNLIPELLKLKKEVKEEIKVEVYTGKKALKNLIEEQIECGEFLGIGMTKKTWEILEFSIPHIVKKAIKHKTKIKLLVYEEAREIYNKLEVKSLQIKYLSQEYYTPSTIIIWKDKISTSYYGDIPTIVVIKNKQINRAYRNYFGLLWKRAS